MKLYHYSKAVGEWCKTCFGLTTATDIPERNHRFMEEALELVQSLGMTRDEVRLLVDYVYNREIGNPPQEVGGVMVTLAALTEASGIELESAAFAELDRIRQPEMIEKIRRKHMSKPRKSPLPGDCKYHKSGEHHG